MNNASSSATASASAPPVPCIHPGGLINSVAYKKGVRVQDVPLDQLRDALANPDWFLWVGLYEPPEESLRVVQGAFGLHDLAIEDAHRAHQRPKLEIYEDSLFVVLRTVHLSADSSQLEFGETHVFVGERYVVSVRHGSLTSHVGMRTRCEATPHLLAKGPAFVLHALMDFIVDQYFPVEEVLREQLEQLEQEIFAGNPDRDVAGRIYRLQRDLLALKHAVSPLIEISRHLMQFESPLIPADSRFDFQNVNDHAIQLSELINGRQHLAQSALEANLALIALLQNEAMKSLAAWAAILAVPTMIAGLYGMNFKYIPEIEWDYGYPVTILVMTSISLMLYRGFKKSGWL